MTSNMLPSTALKRVTLDQMLRHNAHRQGDCLALIDAPDRPLWADGGPRRMTWSQVDAATSAVASRFFEMGLPSEAIVCVQGLNISDTLIGILGCIRAGLVAVVMPVAFDAGRIMAVAERLNAKAILSARKMGPEQPLRMLRHLSAESVADVRFVGAFGVDLPGGIVSFEDCLSFPRHGAVTRLSRLANPEDKLAIVTLDDGPDCIFAVARTHSEWIEAASLVVDGLALSRNARLLSTMTPASLAGLASGMVSWLVSGCRLVLHQPFDATVFGVQLARHDITHVVLPDPVLQAAIVDRLLAEGTLRTVAGLTREPHRSVVLPRTTYDARYFAAIGEVGILPLDMLPDGRLKLPSRLYHANGDGKEPTVETMVDQGGVLGLRGTQIPLVATGMGGDVSYPVSPDGWVTTYYPAIRKDDGLLITGRRFFGSPTTERPFAEPPQAPTTGSQAMLEDDRRLPRGRPFAGAA